MKHYYLLAILLKLHSTLILEPALILCSLDQMLKRFLIQPEAHHLPKVLLLTMWKILALLQP